MKKYKIEHACRIFWLDDISGVLSFLQGKGLLTKRDRERIVEQDAKRESGRLHCALKYSVSKGADAMTEYTSF